MDSHPKYRSWEERTEAYAVGQCFFFPRDIFFCARDIFRKSARDIEKVPVTILDQKKCP